MILSKQFKYFRCVALAVVAGAALAGLNAAEPAFAADKPKVEASLYTRLGGYDAIAAVVADLMPRLMADPALGRFWSNRGSDGVAREKQLVVDFIVAAAGGPLHYAGREMKASHIGMKITDADWQAFMKHLGTTLDKFNLPARERSDVVAFMESTKKTSSIKGEPGQWELQNAITGACFVPSRHLPGSRFCLACRQLAGTGCLARYNGCRLTKVTRSSGAATKSAGSTLCNRGRSGSSTSRPKGAKRSHCIGSSRDNPASLRSIAPSQVFLIRPGLKLTGRTRVAVVPGRVFRELFTSEVTIKNSPLPRWQSACST